MTFTIYYSKKSTAISGYYEYVRVDSKEEILIKIRIRNPLIDVIGVEDCILYLGGRMYRGKFRISKQYYPNEIEEYIYFVPQETISENLI